MSSHRTKEEVIMNLETAIKPLADIADEYDIDGLDEARPEWVINGSTESDLDVELYAGRGGKTLLTLRHAMEARLVLTGKLYSVPNNLDVIKARKIFEALYIGGSTWDSLSQARRTEYIEKVKVLGLDK